LFSLLLNKIDSKYLKRTVTFDFLAPDTYDPSCPVLFINDGQDYHQLKAEAHMKQLYAKGKKLIYVGIYTSEKRLHEYGTASKKDYKGRGSLAKNYTQFILKEFIPNIRKSFNLNLKKENLYFAGFSLGGLSALDISYNHPDIFSKVGVFSGSFWWREKSYEEGYLEDNDRIMHNIVKNSTAAPQLKFWFECGTEDELSDRNKNGIIDSIDDTLDLILELKNKGVPEKHITYIEIKNGKHDFGTWSVVFPQFLDWLL
jgi:enterochelin esterase-like enzyme